ncbi:MAG: glycosyltransferase family 4 protein [Actinomycetota bacterium]
MTSLRIALIASARFPIKEPFAGGLEAHTWALARALKQRGHDVTVFAGAGSDPGLGIRELTARRPQISEAARADVSMPAKLWLDEHHAYLQVLLDLADRGHAEFDVIHNNSLHHLPVAMARMVRVPMISTFHTPPTPWLESALQTGHCPATFTAVSRHTAQAWRHAVTGIRVIRNGVDLDQWRPGPGGGRLLWSGRLVPEKGPDLAIAAARLAGLPLDLVGPIADPQYFAAEVQPLLGGDVRYLGHCTHEQLVTLLGSASACLVTPRWDEPYGLVAAEALACGTPVCGFACGALPELLDGNCAVLAEPNDVGALARGLHLATQLSRDATRAWAVAHCSHQRMTDQYEELYHEVAA